MVSWTTNHVALRRMKAEMRFQWMIFLRHRMLLGQQGRAGGNSNRRREGGMKAGADITPAQTQDGGTKAWSEWG